MKMQTCNYVRSFVFSVIVYSPVNASTWTTQKLCFDVCRQTMPVRRKFLNVMWNAFFSSSAFVCLVARVLTIDCVIVHQVVFVVVVVVFISVFE